MKTLSEKFTADTARKKLLQTPQPGAACVRWRTAGAAGAAGGLGPGGSGRLSSARLKQEQQRRALSSVSMFQRPEPTILRARSEPTWK